MKLKLPINFLIHKIKELTFLLPRIMMRIMCKMLCSNTCPSDGLFLNNYLFGRELTQIRLVWFVDERQKLELKVLSEAPFNTECCPFLWEDRVNRCQCHSMTGYIKEHNTGTSRNVAIDRSPDSFSKAVQG